MVYELTEDIEDRFFDLLMKTLNYSREFVDDRSYASLRFMDLFSNLLQLQPMINEINNEEFYGRLRERIRDRQVMGNRDTRAKLQGDLVQMFLDEWRSRKK